MADDLHPSDIRTRKFRVTRRGYDRAEVGDYLDRVAGRLSSLEDEVTGIHDRLGQLGIAELQDFKTEVNDLSAEIQNVLNAALAAAEGARTRARSDAETMVARAEEASTSARGDAWISGSQLLDQADRTAAEILAEAREDALFVRAEAEQDAKRLVTDARRQADEMVRSSREEGEKIVVIAKAESEAILEGARQSAEKAQERARALENRRTELLGELETAESAIRDLESTKAQALAAPAVGPRVAPTGDDRTHWPQDEGAIRIVPAAEPVPELPPVAVIDAEEMAAEVEEMRSSVTMPEEAVEVDIHDQDEPAAEELAPFEDEAVEPEPAVEPESEPDQPASDDDDEVAVDTVAATEPEPEHREHAVEDKTTVMDEDTGLAALFAKLREPVKPEPRPEQEPSAAPEPVAEELPEELLSSSLHSVPDLEIGQGFERRDRMLLPIENTGLRGLKRHIVELQNRVLEELRTATSDYRLSKSLVVSMLGDDLDEVLRDSYRAGHAATAESMGVDEPLLTGGPSQGAPDELAIDLHRDVQAVISRRGESGNRRLSSDVSRVFRSWRTDDAERHVRMAARRAYNDGLLAGYSRIGVAAVEYVAPGRACGDCAADSGVSWTPVADTPPGVDVPPVSPRCAAMVVPKGSDGFDSLPS